MANFAQSESINFTEMLYSISHELRSPLSNIYRYADWLLSELPDNGQDELRHNLQRIHTSVERSLQLSEPILELIRLEGFTPQYVKLDIASPIKEAIERARSTGLIIKHNLTFHVPPNIPPIQMDAVSMLQVFSILIKHVVAFASQDKVVISVTKEDLCLVITVGEGDPLSFQPNCIVELPANRIKGLLGLELLICNRLVSIHNGRFWASGASDGIQLNFSLPA